MKLLFIVLALPVMASKCGKEKEKDTYLQGKVVRCSGIE
jgi:hypothetical protein